jgi:hypothetical protein
LLESKGVKFIAVTFPVMPAWAERHDPSGATQAGFRSAIRAAIASTKTILVDGMTDWRVPDSAFTDPVHLQRPETAAFTRFIWNEGSATGRRSAAFERKIQIIQRGRGAKILEQTKAVRFPGQIIESDLTVPRKTAWRGLMQTLWVDFVCCSPRSKTYAKPPRAI